MSDTGKKPESAIGVPELVALLKSLQGGGLDPELAELFKTNLREASDEKAKKREMELAARRHGAKMAEARRLKRQMFQDQCPHTKEDNKPAIGGQKNHRGEIKLICMWCFKEFTGQTLPVHLRIPMERVGGIQ